METRLKRRLRRLRKRYAFPLSLPSAAAKHGLRKENVNHVPEPDSFSRVPKLQPVQTAAEVRFLCYA
jgi:hypothetical protein